MIGITKFLAVVGGKGFDWINPIVAVSGIILSVVGSFVIAIFGDDIRAFCRRPKLRILLPDSEGEWTVLTGDHDNPAIYFHILIENCTPVRVAKDVELYILECEVSDVDRKNLKLPLVCPLPISPRRKFNGVKHDRIDIGAVSFAYDLVRCLKSGKTELLLNCSRPNNFTAWIKGSGLMKLLLEARGTNAVSNRLLVKIVWDGVFPSQAEGLGVHLIITTEEK